MKKYVPGVCLGGFRRWLSTGTSSQGEIHGAQEGRVSIIGSHVCYTITGHQSVKVDNPVTSSLYVTTIPEQNPRGFILCDDDRGKKPAQSRVGFIFCLFFYGIHAPPIEIITTDLSIPDTHGITLLIDWQADSH